MKHALLLLVGLGLALSSPLVLAQDEKNQDTEKLKKAREFFEEAEAYYKLLRYDKALAAYEESYLLSREPALLFNIGQCYRLLGKYAEALRTYRSFLRDMPDTHFRKDVEKMIGDIEDLLAGKEAITDKLPNPIEKGAEPTTNPAVVVTSPEEAPASAPVGDNRNPGGSKDPVDTPSSKAHLAFYGGAVAAGALGVVSLLSASAARTEALALLDTGDRGLIDLVALRESQAKTLSGVGFALLGGGAVSGAVGVLLGARTKPAPKESAAEAVTKARITNVSISPWGIVLRGGF